VDRLKEDYLKALVDHIGRVNYQIGGNDATGYGGSPNNQALQKERESLQKRFNLFLDSEKVMPR